MIPLNLIRPIIETVINAVIASEAVFGRHNGKEKKVKALQDATKSAYGILDGVVNLSDDTDKWAKTLIDNAIEKAVEYFNTESEGDFFKENASLAADFVEKNIRSE